MNSLQKMFPSLALFSDIDWETVTQEYETSYADISFPEYLQEKALDGDCPLYLFELAFYEMALNDVKTSMEAFPNKPGIHLNPTALFLSLEFDVRKMLEDAAKGKVEIISKSNVICLYRDINDEMHIVHMSDDELDLLQHLEDGHKNDRNFIKNPLMYKKLIRNGLILDLLG